MESTYTTNEDDHSPPASPTQQSPTGEMPLSQSMLEEDDKGFDEHLDRSSYSQDSNAGSIEEHDDAEDVMNMPPSYAPPARRPSDLGSVLQGSREATPEEIEFAQRRRDELESQIEFDQRCREEREAEYEGYHLQPHHEQDGDESVQSGEALSLSPASGPSISEMQEQADAVELTTGVAVVDPEKLEQLLSSSMLTDHDDATSEDSTREALEMESSPRSDSSMASQYAPNSRARVELPVPMFSGLMETPNLLRRLSLGHEARDNSEPPLARSVESSSNSSIPTDTVNVPAAATDSPPAKRVSFSTAPTNETPFTGTIKQIKNFKSSQGKPVNPIGKENKIVSPHKSRRNASLPEDIAELVREANDDDDATYKDDHATPPNLDVITDGHKAGNSTITNGTDLDVASAKDDEEVEVQDGGIQGSALKTSQTKTDATEPVARKIYICRDDRLIGAVPVDFNNTPADELTDCIRHIGKELGVADAEIDESVRGFLKDPEDFLIQIATLVVKSEKSDAVQDQAEHPVFVKVIGMIPATMFWVAMEPVAWCAGKTYEAMSDKKTYETVLQKMLDLTIRKISGHA